MSSNNILTFLTKCRLDKEKNQKNIAYVTIFKELGVDTVQDLLDLEDDDIKSINFKKLHFRRFEKSLNETKEKMISKNDDKDEDKTDDTDDDTNNKPFNKYQKPIVGNVKSKRKAALLFIGETGVGKSTLLDSLRDYLNGVSFKKIKTTKKTNNKGKSETQDVSQEVLSNDKYSVTIIDTPGLGDTDGIDKDTKHMSNIVEFLGDFGDFNAVCILLRRGSTRKTHRLAYIINEFRMNMPKDVQDNFITIFTRCEVPTIDQDSLNVVKELGLPVKNIIPINNIAYEQQATDEELQNGLYAQIVKEKQETEYYSNHKFLELLIIAASKMKLYQGDKIKNLKQKRDKLKDKVGLLKDKLDASFAKDQELTDKLSELNEMATQESKNVDWDKKRPTTKQTWKSSGRIDTACYSCSRVCHQGCGLSHGDDLNGCACSGSNNHCKVCHHEMKFHHHKGWERIDTTIYEYVFTQQEREKMKKNLNNAKEQQRIISDEKKKKRKRKKKY